MRDLLFWGALLGMALGATAPASAQLFERATVIDNVSIRVSESRRIEGARVVIKGGRIAEIGTSVDKPLLSRTIDGGGGVVTPGWIAVGSQLALDPSRRPLATARAWDGFDRYDQDAISLALSGGVTTVCLTPSGPAGILGVASVVRLAPREDGGTGILSEEAVALCIDLGSDASSLARLRSLATIRKQFRSALDHRESLDLYASDLEEYIEALEKGKKESDASEKNPAEKNLRGADAGGNGGKSGDAKKDAAKKDDEKKAGPKKPSEPKPRPDLEVILRAIDRELPVRIVAHRSADIRNAIELAEEHDLELIICGASEAHLVLDEIAAAEATVVIEPMPAGEWAEGGAARRRVPDLAARLDAAEIPWHLAPGPAIHELFSDALRETRGTTQDAFAALTFEAARFVGLGRRAGRIGRGGEADLVLWSADPVTDPTARVVQVWVGGKSAFRSTVILAEQEKTEKPTSGKKAL